MRLHRRICINVKPQIEAEWPRSDEDSHLEARGARKCHGRRIRKSFRPLLFYGSTCPLGASRKDLAKAVLFLASDDSSYINAVELMVDGGLSGAPFGAPILRG